MTKGGDGKTYWAALVEAVGKLARLVELVAHEVKYTYRTGFRQRRDFELG